MKDSSTNLPICNRLKDLLFVFSANGFILTFLISIALWLVAVMARHGKQTGYDHIALETVDSCKSTAHAKLSVEQAQFLGKNTDELDQYCKSRAMLDKAWINSRTYWDYHYYSHGEVHTPEINFNGVESFNSRAAPCAQNSKYGKSYNIWIFGGSTMQNMETSDNNTIASSLCKELQKTNNVHILNLGVGGFLSEMEIVKFNNLYKLKLQDQASLPDIVIFYDGYNDSQRLAVGASWAGLPPGVSSRLASGYSTERPINRTFYWAIRAFNDYFKELSGGKRMSSMMPYLIWLPRWKMVLLQQIQQST